jgi:hypothetical protein
MQEPAGGLAVESALSFLGAPVLPKEAQSLQ